MSFQLVYAGLAKVRRERKRTVAALKNKAQILSLSFLFSSLAPISSLMIGNGPTSDRPMLPKNNGDVMRRPIPSGHAALGTSAREDCRDIEKSVNISVVSKQRVGD